MADGEPHLFMGDPSDVLPGFPGLADSMTGDSVSGS